MFERYTERARRILFFARYEASEFGSLAIEAEHILLGILREGSGLISRILGAAGVPVSVLRDEITHTLARRKKIATSVELPLTDASKRILRFAAEEADALGHGYIGQEHLLLGALREESTGAGGVLSRHGLELSAVRKQIVEMLPEVHASVERPSSHPVDHIKRLVDELARASGNTPEGRNLLDQIHRALDAVKRPPAEGSDLES